MSVGTLTEEQRAALAAHDRTVSLAAGAGCGKTFVLTERFLSYLDPRQIEPSAELSELVAITFTDAAAREMRQRIRAKCRQRLEESSDSGEQLAWQRLLRTIESARISTIHSFCGTLIRNHAVEAEVDPEFLVLDTPAAELLRLQTLDDGLRDRLAKSDPQTLGLATRFGVGPLREHLANLMSQNILPVAEKWHDAKPVDLVASWQEYHRQTFVPTAARSLANSPTVLRVLELGKTASINNPGFPAHIAAIRECVSRLEKAESQAAAELKQLARVQGVCKKSEWDDPAEYNEFKAACDAVRKAVDNSHLASSLDLEECREAATTGLGLMALAADLVERHTKVKQAENVLEFEDLLTIANRLLRSAEHATLRRRLVGSTRLLLVDEFQDTDPLQVEIVQALCGDDWQKQGLFVVGDQKQSIYRFRGAQPRVSRELQQSLDQQSQLSLTMNFRSQPAILEFVNRLFSDSMGDAYEPLRPARQQLTPGPAIEFLWASEEDEQKQGLPPQNQTRIQAARAREARLMATRLAELIDSQKPIIPVEQGEDIEPVLRPVELGDIAILMRALSDVPIYEDALRQQGLDYHLVGGHAFYAQQEIFDILNLLRAVVSEADELSLAGVLRSPMFALTDETLFWLVQQHGSLNAGLFTKAVMSQLESEERGKVARAAQTLTELRLAKERLTVTQVLQRALELTGYDATLLCEFLGHRKLANVRKLVEQARALDRHSPGDLDGFIRQLSELVVRDPKEPPASTQAEGNVIRIMTIHHAKGLEFPLVVLPDLERSTRAGTTQPVFNLELGPLVPSRDKKKQVGYNLHRFVEGEEDLSERLRLFYVACTRAADYLMLCSSVADLDKPKSEWMKLLATRFDLSTGRKNSDDPVDSQESRIRVTTELPKSKRKSQSGSRGTNLEKLLASTHEAIAAGRGVVPDSVAPIPVDQAARRRFSFSRLSGALHSDEEQGSPQVSAGNLESWDPRDFGNFVHAVFERVSFSNPVKIEDLCTFLAPDFIPENWEEAAATAAKLVAEFLNSDIATSLASAQAVYREVEFLLPWPEAGDAYLSGFIDCLFQDATGTWHLLDYKTNEVASAGVPQLAEHYKMQMYVYGLACKSSLGVEPGHRLLYFLRPRQAFDCQFDEREAEVLRQKVTDSIQAQRQISP